LPARAGAAWETLTETRSLKMNRNMNVAIAVVLLAAGASLPTLAPASPALFFRLAFLEAIISSASGIDEARLQAYASSAFEKYAVIKWLAWKERTFSVVKQTQRI